jgi:hypothetical protein
MKKLPPVPGDPGQIKRNLVPKGIGDEGAQGKEPAHHGKIGRGSVFEKPGKGKKKSAAGPVSQEGDGNHQKGEMMPLGDRKKSDQRDLERQGRRGGEKNARENARRNHRHSLRSKSLKKISRKKTRAIIKGEKGFSKRSRRDYNIIMPGSQKKIRINLALGKKCKVQNENCGGKISDFSIFILLIFTICNLFPPLFQTAKGLRKFHFSFYEGLRNF